MSYLDVDYKSYKWYTLYVFGWSYFLLYHSNMLLHNKNYGLFAKATVFAMFSFTNLMYYKYRKQVLR